MELARLKKLASQPSAVMNDVSHQAFAASFKDQLIAVALRCGQQYWRTPSYIYSQVVLTFGCSILIGFSFCNSENTMQGLQNQLFGVFIFLFVVSKIPDPLAESTYADAHHRSISSFTKLCPCGSRSEHSMRHANDNSRRTHGKPLFYLTS